MEQLASEIKTATDEDKHEEAERLRAIFDQLAKEVKSKTGIHGRSRTFPNPVRRAQDSVGRAVREALTHIRQLHPPLGEYLKRTIDLGKVCSYTPGSGRRLAVLN